MTELFRSAHDALTFAFNYSAQQYALSPMAKLMKTGVGSDKGLATQDGAAQAGMIKSHIARLDRLHIACLVARYAQRYENCPCCENTRKMTDQYRESIGILAEWAISHLTGITLRNARAAIVRSFYERGISMVTVAAELKVAKNTIYDQKSKIFKQLKILDAQALAAIEGRLESMCEANEVGSSSGNAVCC